MTPRFSSRTPHRGLSLIELLVSMAIGLIVIGVGASSYLNVVTNSRTASVLGQMTENASIALGIIRSQVALAGYSRPVGVVTSSESVEGVLTDVNRMNRAYSGIATAGGTNNLIVGCDGAFQTASAHELNISQLTCAAAPANAAASPPPDAIAVVYEADTGNTYPNSDGLPTDCLGQAIPVRTEASLTANPVRLASNKFYVSGNTLYCLGNGRATPLPAAPDDTVANAAQPIVENIYDLQILYGVAAINAVTNTPNKEAIAYLTASAVNAISGTDKWNRVVSARICVEVRSATTVPSSEQTSYLNCQGSVATAPAGQLARTFSTTVVLHNRI